jgi:hypothetical protein
MASTIAQEQREAMVKNQSFRSVLGEQDSWGSWVHIRTRKCCISRHRTWELHEETRSDRHQ